jgi:hypothetical protein
MVVMAMMLNRAFPGAARTFHNLLAPGLHSFAGLGRNLNHMRMMSHLVQCSQGGVTVFNCWRMLLRKLPSGVSGG